MSPRRVIRAVLVCAIYFCLNAAAELLARGFPSGSSIGLCQTPGLTLGLLVLFGPAYAPVALLAQLFTAFAINPPLPTLGMQLLGPLVTTLAYTTVAWVVRRRFGPAPLPATSREATLLAAAAALAPIASALTLAALFQAAGFTAPGTFLKWAGIRWVGGIASILTFVPVVAVHVAPWFVPGRSRPAIRRCPRVRTEIAVQALALCLAIGLIYFWAPLRAHPAFFLCFIPLAWIGLRRGLAGTTLATLAINLGSFIILRMAGAPEPLISDLLLFEISISAVGLGLGAVVDVRNRAEAALAESQARLARVLAGARLGMWDCDLQNGRVTYDEAWAAMADYRLAEVPTHLGWWETQVHPDDREQVERRLQDHLAGRTPFYESEFRFRMRDGAWKWIHARGSVTARDPSGKPLRHAGTQLDLTERKEAEAEKSRLQREVEASRLAAERALLQAQKLESLEVLAGGIAHDFNNLLTVISGNVSLAGLDLPTDAPAAGYLQQTKKAVVRATELCRQMLAYSGKVEFSSVLVNLSVLVEDTAQLLKVTINKNCALEFELDRRLPPVRVDATQIRQIVMNLVLNASDAIGDRGGLIHVATRLTQADAAFLAETSHEAHLQPGSYVTLEVSDNGCGMTPEVKARVFEPFFTTKFAGRGLGLAAVLGIVRSYGGALKVESEPGRGSAFTLLLPAQAGAAEAPVPAAAPPRAEPRPDRGSILVVDDEETVRIVTARLLESHGYETAAAADGREALRIFMERRGAITAVLLDLTMPGMSGAETFQELRRLRPDVPVVLMSGYSEGGQDGRFPDAGEVAFVSKPFERDTLIATIRAAVEKAGG